MVNELLMSRDQVMITHIAIGTNPLLRQVGLDIGRGSGPSGYRPFRPFAVTRPGSPTETWIRFTFDFTGCRGVPAPTAPSTTRETLSVDQLTVTYRARGRTRTEVVRIEPVAVIWPNGCRGH